MKQFLIAIALTMSVTIGVSAQAPDRTRAGPARHLNIERDVDASMVATGRILGLK